MSYIEEALKVFFDNVGQIIGGALLTAIAALLAWFGAKLGKRLGILGHEESSKQLPAPVWTPREYLNDLTRRSSTLSFGDPGSWSATKADKSEGLITLDQVWTPLRVADSQSRVGKVGSHENMAEKGKGVPLLDVFSSTEQPLIILGDPGSGKSTSLAALALSAAKSWASDGEHRLPIWISLESVILSARDPETTLLSGVAEVQVGAARGGATEVAELTRFLRDAILQDKALLLLDGLDEVQEHELDDVRRAIAAVLNAHRNKVVVTCRKFDYRLATPSRKLPIDRELELLPYNDTERMEYVDRWYTAAVRVGRFTPSQAGELSAALVVELKNQDIAELAESPLLLALLTLIHSEEAKLPDTRAVVCERAITYMLADSAKWRVREAGSSTIASPPVLALATELAYENHVAEETSQDRERGLTADTISQVAARICTKMAEADAARGAPSPDDLARRFLKSHGLLLQSGRGRYKFAHRSFQEFLAGQYYAVGAKQKEAISRAPSPHWREPFRLMASLSGHDGQNLFFILTLIDGLVRSASSVLAIQIGAEMLTEIGRRRLALHKFEEVLDETASDQGVDGLWSRARNLIATHVEDRHLPLAARERSATALGVLGDARFTETTGPLGAWRHLLNVSGGPAVIGSTRLDPAQLKTSGGFLGGQRHLEFPAFRISRYLVTNADFRGFVDGDGYANEAYWSGRFARGWMLGDPDVLQTIRAHWLSTVYEHHAKEIRDGEINTKVLEEEATNRTAPRQAPYYWHDRRFNQANQPVVGVNWWEASAFCEWATQEARRSGGLAENERLALPTEFEWEYASRPAQDDRIFPWGDEWHDERAHVSTNTLNMRQPAPVGIYLEHWPGGPCDLAGNVWEWTASLFLPYAPEHDSQRLSSDSFDERVVRGSSWYNSSIVAACSARAVDRSYNLFYDVGFRIVAVPSGLQRVGTTTLA
jgi:formylglycine-generating enzyme required for sulfatase activity